MSFLILPLFAINLLNLMLRPASILPPTSLLQIMPFSLQLLFFRRFLKYCRFCPVGTDRESGTQEYVSMVLFLTDEVFQ